MSSLSGKILNFFAQKPIFSLFVVAAPVVLVYLKLQNFVVRKAEELVTANPAIGLLVAATITVSLIYLNSKYGNILLNEEDPGYEIKRKDDL